MNKVKVLEVNNIDLPGRSFNGYDMINDLKDENLIIKQAVVIKQSNNKNVVNILKEQFISEFYKLQNIEQHLSIHNIFSITTPALFDLKEYKEADIIHFHMFHNTKLSIYSLIKISKEKKVVLTLHDPWFITGRCVHFYNCPKWKKGCVNCEYLNTLFPFENDTCNEMWKLKKYVFDNINIDIIVSSTWMQDLVKNSPILEKQKNVHLIPFGINTKEFTQITKKEAIKHFKLKDDNFVIFLRAQNEFKGTEYVLEALKKLNTQKKLVIITCDNKGLLDEVKNKYKVLDLGQIDKKEMLYAYRACDIFLCPSKGESFGMMAIEAMASERPVIIFNNTALPSVTYAPKCGVLVKDRDVEDLKAKIEMLINNEKERSKRGKLGRKLCEENYDIDKYNNKIKELYINLSKQKKQTTKIENKNEQKNTNKKLEKIFNQITNNETPKYEKIEYSSIAVQEEIMKFNEENYRQIKMKPTKLKDIIKKFPKLYKIAKKIQRRK